MLSISTIDLNIAEFHRMRPAKRPTPASLVNLCVCILKPNYATHFPNDHGHVSPRRGPSCIGKVVTRTSHHRAAAWGSSQGGGRIAKPIAL